MYKTMTKNYRRLAGDGHKAAAKKAAKKASKRSSRETYDRMVKKHKRKAANRKANAKRHAITSVQYDENGNKVVKYEKE